MINTTIAQNFPPFFESCQSSAFRQKYQTKKWAGKKSTCFDFEEAKS